MLHPTLVVGASTNPDRYSYKAATRLLAYGYTVELLGHEPGFLGDIPIHTSVDEIATPLDTVTLYLRPEKQRKLYGQIIQLKPRRVIFNPGAENPEFQAILPHFGIESVEACTLVMLSTNQY
jgi:uncharacterized protein